MKPAIILEFFLLFSLKTGGKKIPSNLFHKVTDTAILHRLPPESRHKVRADRLLTREREI